MIKKSIIQKTVIDLQYHGNVDGFALQHEVGHWCSHALTTTLDDVLAQADTGNRVTTIDRIELEINIDGREDWLSVLLKQIERHMREKLENTSSQDGKEVVEKTEEQHFFETLLHFLEKGYLPWWSPVRNKNEFSTVLSIWIKETLNADRRDRLLQGLQQTVFRQRLIDQLTDEQFTALLAGFYPGQQQELHFLFKDVIDLVSLVDNSKAPAAILQFKQLVCRHAGNEQPREALQQIADELFFLIAAEKQVLLKNADPGSAMMKKTISTTRLEEQKFKGTGQLKEDEAEKEQPTGSKKRTPASATDPDEEAIYLNNAGLVIVAPFLPALFKKLNLATDDSITDPDLAVNLTGYLASGRENMAEFELVLAKILCGLDPEQPVSTRALISDEQKKEAEELLLSVIEYWNMIKDTSITGLQESFLQRDGKLSFKEEAWLLQVEQKTYDMLLQNLPWNISMIKLPWMAQLLKTEWVY